MLGEDDDGDDDVEEEEEGESVVELENSPKTLDVKFICTKAATPRLHMDGAGSGDAAETFRRTHFTHLLRVCELNRMGRECAYTKGTVRKV